MMSASLLEVRELRHQYGPVLAVKDIAFDVPEGHFVSLVGPSGCGKTTTLKLVAGLLQPTAGTIEVDGVDITRQPPRKRPCSLVFQSLALFPHMTVEGNLRYPLDSGGRTRIDKRGRVQAMLALVGLPERLLDRYPSQLSGGERQRVALARSLIYDPRILLLDEPLSSIDFQLRRQLRKTLSDLHRESGKTFLYVTHSLEEALSLSDVIIVMKDGQILQRGSPEQIFASPQSRFVAEFMGDANILPVASREAAPTREGTPQTFWSEELATPVVVERHGGHREGFLVVRAHEVELSSERTAPNAVEVEVFNRYDLGGAIEYALELPGRAVRLTCLMEKGSARRFSPGDKVYAQWQPQAGTVVPR